MKTGIEFIAEERRRQVTQEGWTAEHDDQHVNEELPRAAAAYAWPSTQSIRFWPWEPGTYKPGDDPIHRLAKAGALVAAAIDRLIRVRARQKVYKVSRSEMIIAGSEKEAMDKYVQGLIKEGPEIKAKVEVLEEATVAQAPVKAGNVMDRIKTVEDVLRDNGVEGSMLFNDDEEAYVILKMLARSLNEGWTPNWNDKDQKKYFPWFEMDGSSGFLFLGNADWYTNSLVGSRLCFKTKELAEYAGRQFVEVYKRFMV